MLSESELRLRIHNWAKCYARKPSLHVSNIYPIIKRLKEKDGVACSKSSICKLDYKDAEAVDSAILSLDPIDRETLIEFYIGNRSLIALARAHNDFLCVWERRIKNAEKNLLSQLANNYSSSVELSKI